MRDHWEVSTRPRAPLPRLGFGGAVIGNLYREVSEEAALAAVDAAWNLGIRYFDTAPHYGLGLAERRLGSALAGKDRDEWVLSTKVGRLLVPNEHRTGSDSAGFDVPDDLRRRWDFSRDGVLRSIEESLLRLGVNRLDIVFVHDPDDHVDEAIERAAPALTDLREQGVIRAWGVGMNQCEIPARFVRETDIDIVMVAGRFTLLDQSAADDLLPLCLERRIDVVNVGVFNSGLLSKPRPVAETTFDYRTAPPDLVHRTNEIADLCQEFGTDLPTAALAFSYAHPAVKSVAVGMRSRAQVQSVVSMSQASVPEELWTALAERGLVEWIDSPHRRHC